MNICGKPFDVGIAMVSLDFYKYLTKSKEQITHLRVVEQNQTYFLFNFRNINKLDSSFFKICFGEISMASLFMLVGIFVCITVTK